MFCHFASVIVLHANRQASRNCHMYHQAALQPLLETCWSPMQMLFIVYIQCSLEYISYLASLLVQSPSGACHKTFCEDVLCWWSNGWMDEFLLEGKKKKSKWLLCFIFYIMYALHFRVLYRYHHFKFKAFCYRVLKVAMFDCRTHLLS